MGGLALCPDFSSLADLCRVADFQFVQLLVVSMGMAYILHTCGGNTEALDAFLPTLPLFGITSVDPSPSLWILSSACSHSNWSWLVTFSFCLLWVPNL